MKSIFYRRKEKKGSILTDGIVATMLVVIIAISILVGKIIFTEFNADIQTDPNFNADVKASLVSAEQTYTSTWDIVLFILIIGFWIAMLLTSFYIDSHPVFFFIALIALIITLIICFVIVNAYTELTSEAEFALAAAEFPKLSFVIANLPYIIFFMVLSTGIVLYSKLNNT